MTLAFVYVSLISTVVVFNSRNRQGKLCTYIWPPHPKTAVLAVFTLHAYYYIGSLGNSPHCVYCLNQFSMSCFKICDHVF